MRGRVAVAVVGFGLLVGAGSPALAQSVGAASSFAVEGAAGVTAAGGAGTVITGDVGSSPSASITGFPPAVVVPPFGVHANDAAAIAAQAAATALFTTLGAGACTDSPGPQLSGASFGPGIHCFSSAADLAAVGNLTLTGAGVYIFRVPSALTANVGSTVTLAGVDACQVFWQVGSAATLNGVGFPGNVVAQAGVTLGVGARLTGRALAIAGPVTLSGSNIAGGCSTAPAPPLPPGCPTIALSPSALPGGIANTAYAQSFTASGGVAPYAWTLAGGALPAGLTLTPAGQLSGTPTAAGSFSFTVRATDANGCFNAVAATLVVAAAPTPPATCPPIVLFPATLPGVAVGVPFSQTFTGSGGSGPYSFGVTVGTLPAGLTLSPAGVLSGTVAVAGVTPFTIRGTDAAGCFVERAFTASVGVPVPTLNEWAMIVLTALLIGAGVLALRRRATLTEDRG